MTSETWKRLADTVPKPGQVPLRPIVAAILGTIGGVILSYATIQSPVMTDWGKVAEIWLMAWLAAYLWHRVYQSWRQ